MRTREDWESYLYYLNRKEWISWSKIFDSADLSNGAGSVAYTPELEECSTKVMVMQVQPLDVE